MPVVLSGSDVVTRTCSPPMRSGLCSRARTNKEQRCSSVIDQEFTERNSSPKPNCSKVCSLDMEPQFPEKHIINTMPDEKIPKFAGKGWPPKRNISNIMPDDLPAKHLRLVQNHLLQIEKSHWYHGPFTYSFYWSKTKHLLWSYTTNVSQHVICWSCERQLAVPEKISFLYVLNR